MKLVLVVVCTALAACGGASTPTRRPGQSYLAAIRIEGNHALSTEELAPHLLLHRRLEAARGIDEYQMQTDTTRIEAAYQRLGYFAVEVHARVDRQGEAEIAIFTVTEGPRAFTRVEILGLPPEVPAAKARALVELAEAAPFDYDEYDDAKTPLLTLVQDAGYAYATLDANVIADAPHRLAIARYVIDPGPRCTFGPVSVAGAHDELVDAIRARLAFQPGDTYSTGAIARTTKALYAMNRFSTVRVDFDRNTLSPLVVVKVSVSEGNANELRIGGGGGIDPINYTLRGRATYTRIGWPFELSTATVDFKPAFAYLRDCTGCSVDPRVRLLGTITQQDFLFPFVKGEVEGGLDFLTLEAYSTQGARARVGVTTPLGTDRVEARVGWLVGGYQFNGITITDADAHRIGIDHFERIGAFTQALSIDLRDRPLGPRLGVYAELKLAEGTQYAGSAYDYVQITPDIRAFVPLGDLVFAGRLRFGKFFGEVPPTERYYEGGASSHRGYPERQLSPFASNRTDGSPVVIGGVEMIETGVEMRFPVVSWLEAVLFVDGGDNQDSGGELSLDHIHLAGGVGLRLQVQPGLSIGANVAYRWNHDDPTLPPAGRLQFSLAIGEAY